MRYDIPLTPVNTALKGRLDGLCLLSKHVKTHVVCIGFIEAGCSVAAPFTLVDWLTTEDCLPMSKITWDSPWIVVRRVPLHVLNKVLTNYTFCIS